MMLQRPVDVRAGVSRGVGFHLQRGSGHPAGALPHDLVDQGARLGGTAGGDQAEHGRAFPTRAADTGLLGEHHRIIRDGTRSASSPGLIRKS
jgi:hypothetical protein